MARAGGALRAGRARRRRNAPSSRRTWRAAVSAPRRSVRWRRSDDAGPGRTADRSVTGAPRSRAASRSRRRSSRSAARAPARRAGCVCALACRGRVARAHGRRSVDTRLPLRATRRRSRNAPARRAGARGRGRSPDRGHPARRRGRRIAGRRAGGAGPESHRSRRPAGGAAVVGSRLLEPVARVDVHGDAACRRCRPAARISCGCSPRRAPPISNGWLFRPDADRPRGRHCSTPPSIFPGRRRSRSASSPMGECPRRPARCISSAAWLVSISAASAFRRTARPAGWNSQPRYRLPYIQQARHP